MSLLQEYIDKYGNEASRQAVNVEFVLQVLNKYLAVTDGDLQEALAAETRARQETDETLHEGISAEVQARQEAGNYLRNLIEGINASLAGEIQAKANTASPVFTGTPKVPSKTSAATSDGTLVATEAQVKAVADSNAQKACANEYLSNPALLNAGDGSALPGGLYSVQDGSSLGLGNWWHIIHLRHTHTNGYNAQIAIPFSDPYGLQVRAHDGVSWSPWRKAAFLENDYSRIAVVAKTSDPYDTDLPIGSYIACYMPFFLNLMKNG